MNIHVGTIITIWARFAVDNANTSSPQTHLSNQWYNSLNISFNQRLINKPLK